MDRSEEVISDSRSSTVSEMRVCSRLNSDILLRRAVTFPLLSFSKAIRLEQSTCPLATASLTASATMRLTRLVVRDSVRRVTIGRMRTTMNAAATKNSTKTIDSQITAFCLPVKRT